MFEQPILIAGPPRSGSTMLAGLFSLHGVWIGDAKITAYRKTNSLIGTENIEIKKYLKRMNPDYNNWTTPLPDKKFTDDEISDFKEKISGMVKTKGPWLVKTTNILLTRRLWMGAFPDAYWVFTDRPVNDIVVSVKRHPGMKRHNIMKIRKFVIALRAMQMKTGPIVKNPRTVDMDELVDTKNARQLIQRCGLEYIQHLADDFINRDMWHGQNV